MSVGKAMSLTDKVIHIIGTYGLRLQPEVLVSLRRSVGNSNKMNGNLLSEEEAAMVLARHLYPGVIAELRARGDIRANADILDVWSRFTQQAMYRSDLGLINMTLFNEEILPLIDHVERISRERDAARKKSQVDFAPRGAGLPL